MIEQDEEVEFLWNTYDDDHLEWKYKTCKPLIIWIIYFIEYIFVF